MKRILYVVTLVALALAAPLTAWKIGGSDAAHAGSAPQGEPCASEITPTDAGGQGPREQFKTPELVFINGKGFPPALTALTFTVTHQETATVVASGSFISGADGDFTARLVWDGFNAFEGNEAYRIVVTPAAGGCSAADDIQYLDDRPPPPKRVRICHATSAVTNPYIRNAPAIANNGDLQGGHLTEHQGPVFPAANWGDIIPPYTYRTPNGQLQLFVGYNWTPEGQAIYQNDCNLLPPEPPLDPKPITPLLDCVEILPAGGFLAHFGYDNSLNNQGILVPVGPNNGFSPLPLDRGQPIVFEGGIVLPEDADIQAESEDGSPLTWSLTGNEVTATHESERCEGSITINKEVEGPLDPDPGRFNLEIDGKPIGEPARDGDSRTAAVTTGPHTVGETGAGTDLSDFYTEIVCRTDAGDGDVVASGDGTSVPVTVGRGEALVCTITNTRQEGPGPDPLALTPVLECVVMNDGEPDIAVWGYQNPNDFVVTVPIGGENGFSGGSSQDLGQPETFEEGRLIGVFQTPFEAGGTTLVWTLTGKTATASAGSPRCTATVELRKVVVPADDPGMFNLLINGKVLATGGNGTSTGPLVVGVGEGTASETAGEGTNLSNYETTIDCTRNGVPVPSVEGTKVDGAVATGDVVVCTFTNRRSTTPPVEPPVEPPVQPPVEPPVQPPVEPPVQPPVEPPVPPAEQLDLVVTKTAEPTTVQEGELITWTMTVTNNSSVEAADVNGARADDRPYGMRVLSLTPSQGVCTIGAGCALGRLLPGGSVTVTAVTVATQVGDVVNCVEVGSEEIESDYLNNTACALARVIGNPPPDVDRCGSLVVSPRVLVASRESVVLTRARTLLGRPVAGILVRAKGAGVVASARTNARGIARFVLTPPRLGIIRFTPTGLARTTTGSRCRTLVGVLAPRQPPPLTGRDG